MIDLLPEWLQIFTLSMVPGIESRYVVPYAIYRFGWEWWQVFPIAIAGNIILVPFGLLFLRSIEQYLKKYGFEKNIEDTTHPINSIKKLLAGRIDVFAYKKYVTMYVAKINGINPDDLEVAYKLTELDVPAYLACCKETPDSIVERFRVVLKKIKKDGRYAKIIKKWFK